MRAGIGFASVGIIAFLHLAHPPRTAAQERDGSDSHHITVYVGFLPYVEGPGLQGPRSPLAGAQFVANRRRLEWLVADAHVVRCCDDVYVFGIATGLRFRPGGGSGYVGAGGGFSSTASGENGPTIHAAVGAGSWGTSGLRVELRVQQGFGGIGWREVLFMLGYQFLADRR